LLAIIYARGDPVISGLSAHRKCSASMADEVSANMTFPRSESSAKKKKESLSAKSQVCVDFRRLQAVAVHDLFHVRRTLSETGK
jgi:hypothetical protein